MANLSVQDWKTFLDARLTQEKGDDAKALQVFDELLAVYPDNRHLQSSRAFALERLGRGEEAIASRIAVKYAEIGRTLIGPADKPDAWTQQITSLLDDVEEAKANNALSAALIAW